jgi:hypothetical protein
MLTELLEKVLRAGGDELEIEYRDRKEWFTAFNGPIGFDIGSLDSDDIKPVFKEMDELKKRKQVSIGSRTYALCFREFESFGEMVYRIHMKEIRSNKGARKKVKDVLNASGQDRKDV